MDKLLALFQGFSIWFKVLINEMANNSISILFIILVYLSLWYFPQTIDLLLILNQADAFFLEIPLYFGSLTISAFLIWNVPKYYFYHNYKDITLKNFIGFVPNQHYRYTKLNDDSSYPYKIRFHVRKVLPRILAISLLLIAALSILNAMEEFNLENFYTTYLNPNNTLVICIFFLLLLTVPEVCEILRKIWDFKLKSPYVLPLLSVGLFIFIISLGTLNIQAEQDLGKLFLAGSALTILFATLCFNSYTFLKKVSKSIFYASILVSGFLVVIIILILNFYPELASYLNPLSILIFSLLSLYIVCFLCILAGKKIKLPLLTIVFFLAIFSSRFFTENSDHYHINTVKTNVKRENIETYICQWLSSRKTLIENSESFPVLLVSAEGGGSRAGLWAFLVHSYLSEKSKGAYFKNHLLSLTGASGGGVGNGMFFSTAMEAKNKGVQLSYRLTDKSDTPFTYKASKVYQQNYLSEALLSLLGRDLLKEITGLFNFRNRGELLEDAWSNRHNEVFTPHTNAMLLKQEFLSFYRKNDATHIRDSKKFVPPLLMVNTTHTQTGSYNVISPVAFSHQSEFKGITDFYHNLGFYNKQTSIKLVSALRMNASFPYVTPVGEIRSKQKMGEVVTNQYADSGYYDNIGGVVSKGIESVFKKVLQESFPELRDKINLKQVLIGNERKRKIAKTESQIAAPLTTLGNVRYGHTQEIMKKLGLKYAIRLKPTEIKPKISKFSFINKNSDSLTIKPILPLGRYLSTTAIRSIEARLVSISKQLDALLEE